MDITIYTDGSYNKEDGRAHGGVVIMDDDGSIKSKMHVISTLGCLTSMNNVGGEIIAAYAAIKSIYLNHQKGTYNGETVHVCVRHDYEGISKWVLGDWKAKKQATIWYANIIRNMTSDPKFRVRFEWVKGHSTDVGNKEADAVADYEMPGFEVRGIQVVNLDKLLMSEGLR